MRCLGIGAYIPSNVLRNKMFFLYPLNPVDYLNPLSNIWNHVTLEAVLCPMQHLPKGKFNVIFIWLTRHRFICSHCLSHWELELLSIRAKANCNLLRIKYYSSSLFILFYLTKHLFKCSGDTLFQTKEMIRLFK